MKTFNSLYHTRPFSFFKAIRPFNFIEIIKLRIQSKRLLDFYWANQSGLCTNTKQSRLFFNSLIHFKTLSETIGDYSKAIQFVIPIVTLSYYIPHLKPDRYTYVKRLILRTWLLVHSRQKKFYPICEQQFELLSAYLTNERISWGRSKDSNRYYSLVEKLKRLGLKLERSQRRRAELAEILGFCQSTSDADKLHPYLARSLAIWPEIDLKSATILWMYIILMCEIIGDKKTLTDFQSQFKQKFQKHRSYYSSLCRWIAETLVVWGDYEEALPFLASAERYLDYFPALLNDSRELHTALISTQRAVIYSAQGDEARASEEYGRATRIAALHLKKYSSRETFEIFPAAIRYYLKKGLLTEAETIIHLYERNSNLDRYEFPDFLGVLELLKGRTHFMRGDYTRSQRSFRNAVELLQFGLSNRLEQCNAKYALAEAKFHLAQSLDSKKTRIAEILASLKEFEELGVGEERYGRAILASIQYLLEVGDLKSAKDLLSKIRGKTPYPFLKLGLIASQGQLLLEEGFLDEAKEIFDKIIIETEEYASCFEIHLSSLLNLSRVWWNSYKLSEDLNTFIQLQKALTRIQDYPQVKELFPVQFAIAGIRFNLAIFEHSGDYAEQILLNLAETINSKSLSGYGEKLALLKEKMANYSEVSSSLLDVAQPSVSRSLVESTQLNSKEIENYFREAILSLNSFNFLEGETN